MTKTNQLTTVPDGYARNYLLPQGLAKPATTKELAQSAVLTAEAQAQLAAKQKTYSDLLASLQGVHITIKAKANAQGKLFAALSPAAVLAALQQRQLAVDSEMLALPVVKNLGDYQVTITLPNHSPVVLPLTVEPS